MKMAHRALIRQKHALNMLARTCWSTELWIFYLPRLKKLSPTEIHQNRQHLIRSMLFSTSYHKCATHYDVLGVAKEATQKEIKEAYIRLGKEYHPDMHQSLSDDDHQAPGATNEKEDEVTKKFKEINEAYEVLGRIGSKSAYDIALRNVQARNESRNSVDPTQQHATYKSYNTFEERAQAAYGYKVDPDYWTTRQDKYKIASLCVVFMILGFLIHFQIARLTSLKHGQWLDNNTKILNNSIEDMRENAQKQGNVNKGDERYNTLLAKYNADREAARNTRNA